MYFNLSSHILKKVKVEWEHHLTSSNKKSVRLSKVHELVGVEVVPCTCKFFGNNGGKNQTKFFKLTTLIFLQWVPPS